MNDLVGDVAAFRTGKKALQRQAAERASCLIVAGVDLDEMLAMPTPRRTECCRRLKRLLERERLKGGRGHWSYDLNRHIALKRVLDRLAAGIGGSDAKTVPNA